MTVEAVGKTRRGRGARTSARKARDFTMLPALKRGVPLTEPMDREQIERIDAASMQILENVGVHFGLIRTPLITSLFRQSDVDAGTQQEGGPSFLPRHHESRHRPPVTCRSHEVWPDVR